MFLKFSSLEPKRQNDKPSDDLFFFFFYRKVKYATSKRLGKYYLRLTSQDCWLAVFLYFFNSEGAKSMLNAHTVLFHSYTENGFLLVVKII